jgi:hypothetical protein
MNDKDKPTVLLEYYLKKLRLPTMLREYAPMSAVCRDERSDFPVYLLRLAEREILDREKRAAERRIKEARFYSAHRQFRNGQDPSGLCPGFFCLRHGPQSPFPYSYRIDHGTC